MTKSAVLSLERIWGPQLSQRELEVGSLAIAGHSTQEIASALYISENTVKTHLRNLFRKTKTHSRIELYRMLVEAGSAAGGFGAVSRAQPGTFEQLFLELRGGRDGGAHTTVVLIQLQFLQREEAAPPSRTTVADLLATSIRRRDHLFHWRDDLYLLVLPGSDKASALDVAERLLRKVERWAGLKELVSVASVGAATLDEGEGSADSVVELAARRLKRLQQADYR